MKFLPQAATRTLGRKVLQAKKQSPHIFFAAGVVGVIGGAVLASRATLKLNDHLDELNHEIEIVKGLAETAKERDNGYLEEDYYRDLGYVYAKNTVAIVKLYGPALIVGGLSIASLTGAHVQLTRRNTALTAVAAGAVKLLEEYRDHVAEELGAEREKELFHNIQEVEDENKKVVKVANPNDYSQYARIFDESCPNWEKNPEINRLFVQCQQNYANHLLNARGHVFLNEVYDMLGFERSSAGQVVGWVRNGGGDNYVDFGMFETRSARFVNGIERSIVLDFNVDGLVYDQI